MRKSRKKREKRIRAEKLISEREFLTGERKTKDDLPTHLEIIDPKKEAKLVVNGLTRKYLGSGKKPKWMNCLEEEVNGDGEKTENSS